METITLTAEHSKTRSVHQVALSIMALAMESKDVLHVFIEYAPHVDAFDVFVYPSSVQHETENAGERLLSKTFYFSRDSIGALLSIEDQLTELVAEARDNAEVVA
ncbi:hypothetical protein [Photobacterium halotolerans]|uniref:Uncharacterized protein n=1 Tax=Photobacterium halotolerans TaxID=265726 RepID=A0A0F5VIS3_9GAMM|nr:hypothetical protein [Photobacterium halotolerans]KKD01405.1 hypothetical protein KY46_00825 [Photobacterium halotolerans]